MISSHRFGQTAFSLCLTGLMFSLQGFGLRAGAAKTSITSGVHDGKVYMAGFGFNWVASGVLPVSLLRVLRAV